MGSQLHFPYLPPQSVYKTTAPYPAVPPPVCGWEYLGCYASNMVGGDWGGGYHVLYYNPCPVIC